MRSVDTARTAIAKSANATINAIVPKSANPINSPK